MAGFSEIDKRGASNKAGRRDFFSRRKCCMLIREVRVGPFYYIQLLMVNLEIDTDRVRANKPNAFSNLNYLG